MHANRRDSLRQEVSTPPADTELTRRTALKLLSATALLAAGGAGCTRKPERRIVSLAETPEYRKPGIPLHYASTWTDGLTPYGMVVRTVEGRPVKIEGLAGHPLNDGTSNAAMQATLLSLYDPERLRTPVHGGREVSWEEADRLVVGALRKARSTLLVTRSTLGPSERLLAGRFAQVATSVRHLVYEPLHDGARRAGWKQAYGAEGVVRPDLARARVVLSIDADFLGTDGDVLSLTRAFARARNAEGATPARLYVAESAMTVTGSNADVRIPLRPSAAPGFVAGLRRALGGANEGVDAAVGALAADLRAHRGQAVVLTGAHLPAAVHAAVAALNEDLGAPLLWNAAPSALPADDPATIAEALAAGPDVVLLLGVNPAHTWPGGDFAALLGRAGFSVGHGLTHNETLGACSLALPGAHNLESWNDAAPLPGVESLCQPVIAPLFGGRQEADSLLAWTRALGGDDAPDFHAFLRRRWHAGPLRGAVDAERAWEDALRRGFTGQPADTPVPRVRGVSSVTPEAGVGFDVIVAPHHALFDGRFAGNAWLLEHPDPVSKLVWDNAAALGPATAERLGVGEGDWIRVDGVELPVLVQPGVAPDVVVTTLGHGRRAGAGVGVGVGVNTAPLLAGEGAHGLRRGAAVARVGREPHTLVRTQQYFDAKGRPLALEGTLEEYRDDPAFVRHKVHVPPLRQLHDAYDYSQGHKWAMAIDLSACTGCGVCMVACQSENNVPVVGKDECGNGREMSWIRIDRYESGDPANPEVLSQPMLCQHCDNAPCENVCPVNATAHSPEGLNEQVYNRCVGTRYCGNNCPYKVRRFNFFSYQKDFIEDPVQELLFNPQVTVRMRGVMEKCTFCVQRINAARFAASNADAALRDGAVRTACQQACPAQAIVFGDVNDPDSAIARARASGRAYHVLEELNVRPNVSYLARIRNTPAGGGHG